MAGSNQTRLFLLLAVIPLLVGVAISLTVGATYQSTVSAQQRAFGESTAGQLSDNLSRPLFESDLVSLNVLVTQLASESSIHYIAVYDDQNALIAQAGSTTSPGDDFTREITFQDSMIGFVRVSVTQPETIGRSLWSALGIAAAIYLVFAWLMHKPLYAWLTASPKKQKKKEEATVSIPILKDTVVMQDQLPKKECILVTRIRPAAYLEQHFDAFYEAACQLGGIVEQTTPEELVIHFETHDAMFKATATGLTIRELTKHFTGKIQFGGTLDVLNDEEPDKIRKSASYLASISDGDLILANGKAMIDGRAELQPFHHALVDSDDLFKIPHLHNNDLVIEQLKAITRN